MSGLIASGSLKLETCRRNNIENFMSIGPVPNGRIQIDLYRNQYENAIHRPVGPSARYNCHGLTFASRRTCIEIASEVQKIINDDDYTEIDIKNVLPGDIAIYYNSNPPVTDIEHSGIVVSLVKTDILNKPKILSKWGGAHEVIHFPEDCPYNCSNVRYFRCLKYD